MKLLFAEDEKELSRAVATILRRSGYEVDTAYDGDEALRLAGMHYYDALILDIMMPKKHGMEVLRTLRQEGNVTPVLMLTAKSEVEDKVAGLEEGANDYLTKPFAVKELIARIKAMTRSREEMTPELIQVGGICVNRREQTLEGAGGSVSLNHQELELLEYFLRNAGKAFTRAQIKERFWREAADDLVVEVYVSYLMHKLESVRAKAAIHKDEAGNYQLLI
ncbi:MAG: response regulator transcription factor [Lachnospiraceae bacterium]|nr:response regulator transcription factor [Lachnospiraceae bacterium]